MQSSEKFLTCVIRSSRRVQGAVTGWTQRLLWASSTPASRLLFLGDQEGGRCELAQPILSGQDRPTSHCVIVLAPHTASRERNHPLSLSLAMRSLLGEGEGWGGWRASDSNSSGKWGQCRESWAPAKPRDKSLTYFLGTELLLVPLSWRVWTAPLAPGLCHLYPQDG